MAVVTQLRDPTSRVISAYEFAVSVAAESLGAGGEGPSLQAPEHLNYVNTMEVWPWSILIPWFRRDMQARVSVRASWNEVLPCCGPLAESRGIVLNLHAALLVSELGTPLGVSTGTQGCRAMPLNPSTSPLPQLEGLRKEATRDGTTTWLKFKTRKGQVYWWNRSTNATSLTVGSWLGGLHGCTVPHGHLSFPLSDPPFRRATCL